MSKIIRNLIGILLLATAVAVTQIPVSDVEAAPTASASDFQMDGTTLVKYNGTAQNVSISNYVEKIEALRASQSGMRWKLSVQALFQSVRIWKA